MIKNKKILLLTIPILLYSFFVSYLNSINFFAIFIASILIFLAFFSSIKNYKNKTLFVIYLFIFLLQLALIIYNSKYRNIPFTNIDWKNYDFFAKSALANSNSFFDIFSNAIDLFTAFVAILYKIFGSDISIIYFYILPLSHISVKYLYKVMYKLTKNEKISCVSGLILLIYPVNFIFSMSVLREIPIQCLIIMSFYFFVDYYDNKSNISFVKSILLSLLAALMHSGIIGVFIIYLYMFFQNKIFKNIKFVRISMIIATFIIILILSFTPIWSKTSSRFNNISSTSSLVSKMNEQNDYLSANTQYIKDVPDTFGELILTFPYRFVMFIISPLPWQVYDISTAISLFLDGFFRYYIVYMLIKILFSFKKRSNKSKRYLFICITLFLSLFLSDFIFSLGVNNYGQAMRHRTKILPLEIILITYYKGCEKNET